MPENKAERRGQGEKQRDLEAWLRGIPFEILQELERRYELQKRVANVQNAGKRLKQIFPKIQDKAPPSGKVNVIVLRKSIFFLVLTIFGIELFFDFIYIGLRIIPLIITVPFSLQQFLAPFYVPLFIFLNIIKVFFMLLTAYVWIGTRYELIEGEVRFKYGLIFTNEKIFLCTYTQEVICTQSFLGRVFNYGTIEMYNPVMKETLYLDSVPNPHKYVEIIREGLPKLPETGLVPL